jgi:Receptor L domain
LFIQIREVTGYVLIASVFVEKIPLLSLRIIRGRELFEERNGSYALFVLKNYDPTRRYIGIKELQLPSLHGKKKLDYLKTGRQMATAPEFVFHCFSYYMYFVGGSLSYFGAWVANSLALMSQVIAVWMECCTLSRFAKVFREFGNGGSYQCTAGGNWRL